MREGGGRRLFLCVDVCACIRVHNLRVLFRKIENTSLYSHKGGDQETLVKQELKVWNFQVVLVLSPGKDGTAASPSVELLLLLECDVLLPAERPAGF